jgi:hypothetical protein
LLPTLPRIEVQKPHNEMLNLPVAGDAVSLDGQGARLSSYCEPRNRFHRGAGV